MLCVINYEDELEQVLFDTFKYIYGISNINVLYRYLQIRHLIVNEKKTFCEFIVEELAIVDLKYKGEKIYIYGNCENSLCNIIENLNFKNSLIPIIDENNIEYEFNNYIKKTYKNINEKSKKLSKSYTKDKYYKYHLIYHQINLLNKLFNVNLNSLPNIEGLTQNLSEHISLEDKCIRYTHASNFNTNNVKSISEEDLEAYLYKNLDLVEIGLKPLKRQFEIDNGRIDILARDKNGKIVILELKIEEDKHLIWQVMYYPNAVKKIMNCKDVRVITICPSYPPHIKTVLDDINYVEMINYDILISNNKIENIKLNKIK